MMKRVTWFVGGAVAGVAGAGYAKRKVKETAAQLAPVNVARTAVGKVRERGTDVVDAVREGRDAMRAKEAELRARISGAPTLADEIEPGTRLLLDGQPVEPGRVIVLREVRDERAGRRARRGA